MNSEDTPLQRNLLNWIWDWAICQNYPGAREQQRRADAEEAALVGILICRAAMSGTEEMSQKRRERLFGAGIALLGSVDCRRHLDALVRMLDDELVKENTDWTFSTLRVLIEYDEHTFMVVRRLHEMELRGPLSTTRDDMLELILDGEHRFVLRPSTRKKIARYILEHPLADRHRKASTTLCEKAREVLARPSQRSEVRSNMVD